MFLLLLGGDQAQLQTDGDRDTPATFAKKPHTCLTLGRVGNEWFLCLLSWFLFHIICHFSCSLMVLLLFFVSCLSSSFLSLRFRFPLLVLVKAG